jgi:hypothetical protein
VDRKDRVEIKTINHKEEGQRERKVVVVRVR